LELARVNVANRPTRGAIAQADAIAVKCGRESRLQACPPGQSPRELRG
jgi:hypothetical protein